MPIEGPGDLVRALREALKKLDEKKWTQKEIAKRAGFPEPEYVTRVEIGKNKLTTTLMRDGLARGFGLTPSEFSAYLDRHVKLSDVVERIHSGTPLNLGPPTRSASWALVPAGVDAERLHAELRAVLDRDLIPLACRDAIPALLDISYLRGSALTQEGWVDEARQIHARLDAIPDESVERKIERPAASSPDAAKRRADVKRKTG